VNAQEINVAIAEKYTVSEGIGGSFHYHLSNAGNPGESICGKQTFFTLIPVSAWGTVTHLRERYCAKCMELATDTVKAKETP